jgi:hypothetical protein
MDIIACYSICNGLGIYILKIEGDDVYWRYSNEDKVRKSRLKVNKMDNFVFRCGSVWYDLNEFIKVGI